MRQMIGGKASHLGGFIRQPDTRALVVDTALRPATHDIASSRYRPI
jgi:hypothetical protein